MGSFTPVASSGLNLPPDCYIYQILPLTPQTSPTSYAPLTNGTHLAALSSNNAVSLIDAESLKLVSTLQDVSTSVTCMIRYTAPDQPCTTLITTGRDGLVRTWDLRSGKLVSEGAATLERLGKQSLSALVANASNNVIVAGTELFEREGPGDAPVFVWDARNLSAPHHVYTESHTDTVTDLRFHPTQENVLLTASTDGLINLINVAEADEDEAVLQVINHKSALHYAGFLGDALTYGLGTDETLSFYQVENAADDSPAKQPTHLGDLRETLDVEYIVNIYPGDGEALPYVVGGKHSSHVLDFVPLVQSGDAWVADIAGRMRCEGAHGEEIVRDVHVNGEAVFTCGEDGMVKAWRKPGSSSTVEGEKARMKKEKRTKGKEGRFAPY